MKTLGSREASNSCYNICISEQSTATIFFIPGVITFFTSATKIYVAPWKMPFKNVLFRTIILVKVANWVLKVVSVFACLINYNLLKSTLISNYWGMYLGLKLFF